VDLPMFSLVGSAYGIPNEAGTYVNVPLPVRIGAFRGNNYRNWFARAPHPRV
jgi:hypothetical protein